ncbi:MAG: hypothetical protein IK060_03745 [Methanomicrobium sp.]|nr:hypothetical protein [Methanomicrobium sp.]
MSKKVNENMTENMSENMNENMSKEVKGNMSKKVNENILKDALNLIALLLYCAAVFVIADGGFGGFWVGIGLFAAATYIVYYSGGIGKLNAISEKIADGNPEEKPAGNEN